MKKTLSFLLLALLCLQATIAQNEGRPGWTRQTPKAGNSTYMYVVERSGGKTPDEARNKALARVYQSTMMRIGAVVSWDEINKSLQAGEDWGTVSMKYNIPVNKVCEHVEKNEQGYLVILLCQVAKYGNVYPNWDEFSGCYDVKTYDNSTALLKSAIIPGLGQIGKRHYTEGILIMLGEAALISGAAVSYSRAQNHLNTIKNQNNNIEGFNHSCEKYENYQKVNLVCISAAGVLYLYNLIRAYTLTPKYKNNILSFTPSIIPTESGIVSGLNLTLTF